MSFLTIRVSCRKTCGRGAKWTQILRMNCSTRKLDLQWGVHVVDQTDVFPTYLFVLSADYKSLPNRPPTLTLWTPCSESSFLRFLLYIFLLLLVCACKFEYLS